MTDKQILASPNWYNSSISDVSADGIFAFGGKNTIFLIDLAGADSCQLLGQLCGHKDRVTSVRFCQTPAYSRLCVSGSEDHCVVIWDVDAKATISRHNKHQSKVTAVYWCLSSHDWIFSGDEKGHLFSWNHQLNIVYEHCPIPGHIFCISCSPEEEGLVVVGYKTGQILVLLLKNERHEVVSLLKGHNDEIHSLVWSPVKAGELPEEVFGTRRKQESGYILASGSRDKTIRLWNIQTGQYTAVVNIPSRTSTRRTGRDEQYVKSKLWLTLCWSQSDSNYLISSGYNGDILLWDLSKASKQKWQLFGDNASSRHSRIVFNICQYAAKEILVTVSMDRLINIWRANDAKILCSLPSLGGFAYSLDISLMDPSSIAMGVGDNMIRIWETSSTKESYAVKTLWRGIGTKVMKILWHPVKEGLLAFGTEEGKVGVYNVMSQIASVSRTYHKKSVYSLSWGPPTGNSDGRENDNRIWHLYSCGGEGIVLEHKPESLHDEAKSLDKLIKITNNIKHNLAGHSEVSWKPDRTIVAIGNEDGSIQLYRTPDLKLLSTINVHNKSITCLTWYYSSDANDLDSFLLASSSNGYEIHIHDLRNVIDAHDKAGDDQAVITSSFQRLVGHSGRVTNVVWSPHSSSRLASSSYDGTVQVWDVLKGEGLANYRGHSGRVMSVAWSVMDSDVLFSGSEDFTVRSWRISQQMFREPPTESKKPLKSKGKKKKKKTSAVNQNLEEDHQEIEPALTIDEEKVSRYADALDLDGKPEASVINHDIVVSVSEKSPDELGESSQVSLQFLSSGTERNCQDMYGTVTAAEEPSLSVKADMKKKKKKGKSLFPLSASADNRSRIITSQECVDIAKYLSTSTDGKRTKTQAEGNVNLGFFTDRESAFDMLTEEGIHHFQTGNIDYQLQLEVWKGNIGKALDLAVEKRQLTDWLVGLSHLAGKRVQLAVTEAFAEQLASQGSYHRAALYYLACHKVHDAIRMFQTFGMYREAIALAKVRLLPSDPVLLDIYSSWARKLENECAFEQAAKCYLACGLRDDATRVLTRRDDDISLAAAAQVARLSGRTDLSEALILQCALSATRNAKWNDAYEMVSDYSNMQPFLMLMFTHKVLVVNLLETGVLTSDDFPEMQQTNNVHWLKKSSELPQCVLRLKAQFAKRQSSDATCHWGFSAAGDSYSVQRIIETWWSCCRLNSDEKRLHGFYVQISAFGFGQTASKKESLEHDIVNISKDVCLGLVASLVDQPNLCFEHFIKAVVKCHDCGRPKLLRHLFIFLFPYGLESWYMIKGLSESPLQNSMDNLDQSFCNMTAFYYRALLNETLNECYAATKGTSDSDSSVKDTSHKEPVEYLQPTFTKNNGGESPDSLPNDNLTSNNELLAGSEIKSSPEMDSGCSNTNPLSENVEESACKVQHTSVSDIYRIALVSSTVILSEVNAQFQNTRENLLEGGAENQAKEWKQLKDGSSVRSELEIRLSKFPFPDVIEAACAIVDLCIHAMKLGSEKEKDDFLKLSRQVIHWATRHVRHPHHKAFFKTALDKLNDCL